MTDPLDDAVSKAVAEVNKATKKPPLPIAGGINQPPEYRIMELSDNLADTIMENANAQKVKAENNFKMAEQAVEEIKNRTKRIWGILQDFEKELEEYGLAELELHRRFAKKGNSK